MRSKGLLRFAVTAPGGIELEQNIVLVVQHNFLVVVGHYDLNRALLLLWNRLRLDAGVNLAVNEVLDKCTDIVVCDFLVLVKGKFLILDSLLDSESWPFAIFEIEVAGVCAERLGVNSGEADDTLVLLCQGLEFGGQFSALFWGFREYVG